MTSAPPRRYCVYFVASDALIDSSVADVTPGEQLALALYLLLSSSFHVLGLWLMIRAAVSPLGAMPRGSSPEEACHI